MNDFSEIFSSPIEKPFSVFPALSVHISCLNLAVPCYAHFPFSDTMSDNPLRLDFNRQWSNFTNDVQRYELDIWLYNNNPDLGQTINRTMEGIPDLLLLHEILTFHERSQRRELTDEWLANSQIGRLLQIINTRILAVVERTILGEINGEHIRCSLLLGPIH